MSEFLSEACKRGKKLVRLHLLLHAVPRIPRKFTEISVGANLGVPKILLLETGLRKKCYFAERPFVIGAGRAD